MKRLVFITGGSRGVGKALVKVFYLAGYDVAFSYLSQKSLAESFVTELQDDAKKDDFYGKIYALQMDQGNEENIQQGLQSIHTFFGCPIDILINNAAMAQEKPFLTISADDWDKMLKVNLQGPFILSQQVVPAMAQQGWGRIINITSIGGQWGGFNQVHYAASKAGLISLTQSLAKIYSKDGVSSSAIAIGLVATDMSAKELATDAGQKKVESIPSQRLGTADEIAQMALFLASENGAYLTGQTLNANGGLYFG
ncbi:MAG: 3-oxoacyl-ACP reductase [Gammaproteobacteria bacterium CG22_combo_CG10-13_8_21_14_all_40_8]|nr:MAG: 3-oxoacyl-ACP reductase [Gammaproteobacteria bacterium CG22_combo_CG10-13_8_21_14_all_40_8]